MPPWAGTYAGSAGEVGVSGWDMATSGRRSCVSVGVRAGPGRERWRVPGPVPCGSLAGGRRVGVSAARVWAAVSGAVNVAGASRTRTASPDTTSFARAFAVAPDDRPISRAEGGRGELVPGVRPQEVPHDVAQLVLAEGAASRRCSAPAGRGVRVTLTVLLRGMGRWHVGQTTRTAAADRSTVVRSASPRTHSSTPDASDASESSSSALALALAGLRTAGTGGLHRGQYPADDGRA